jgi:hypothetical protein
LSELAHHAESVVVEDDRDELLNVLGVVLEHLRCGDVGRAQQLVEKVLSEHSDGSGS